MRNLEKIVTLLQEEVSNLKERVGPLEAQVKLLQIHLSIKERPPTTLPPLATTLPFLKGFWKQPLPSFLMCRVASAL
jgi:hypothetical protein